MTQHIIDRINILGKHQGSNGFDDSDLDLTSSDMYDHKESSTKNGRYDDDSSVIIVAMDDVNDINNIVELDIETNVDEEVSMAKHDKYAQVSVKEGIRRHGQKAIDAVLTEYAQLNNRNIFEPKHAHELGTEVKREALNLITLIKEKRCGKGSCLC